MRRSMFVFDFSIFIIINFINKHNILIKGRSATNKEEFDKVLKQQIELGTVPSQHQNELKSVN